MLPLLNLNLRTFWTRRDAFIVSAYSLKCVSASLPVCAAYAMRRAGPSDALNVSDASTSALLPH